MPANILCESAGLRARLDALIRAQPCDHSPVDVVVTVEEINDKHGTGVLVKRLFKGRRNVVSIRSRDQWGEHDFGDWNIKISQPVQSRAKCFHNVLSVLAGCKVRSTLCIPFRVDELLTSIALKAAFDARLCAYIMDDQNVAVHVIPDEIMREFLEKCSLRLATHPELRLAYERKYGLPFSILPAVVPEHLLATEPIESAYSRKAQRGALIGSFWDQVWFDRLSSALKGCDWRIDWYGNHQSSWLKFPAEELKQAGITPFGIVSEERLAAELRQYPFVIVPVGTLDGKESNQGVASLSLPGRILFAAATSHTPILVVGNENTSGARFVRHFGIGETVPYDAGPLSAAMDRLSDPKVQMGMRRNAAAVASAFSDRGIVKWLASSIEQGRPADTRFEEAFAGYNG